MKISDDDPDLGNDPSESSEYATEEDISVMHLKVKTNRMITAGFLNLLRIIQHPIMNHFKIRRV